MPEITPRTFKGTRDYLPQDMRLREKIFDTMKSVFKNFGFAPLETPAMEFLEILAGKYGEDADKLLYPLAYKGGKELALRYDLTVPLARVVAMNPHMPKPFKRFQIQPVWRADNPQLKRGRYREFYQCDVDTVGTSEPLADAEIISLMVTVFEELGLGNCAVHLNSRKVLSGMIQGAGFSQSDVPEVCRSIDKLDKEGVKGVKSELVEKGYGSDIIENICGLLENKKTGIEGIDFLRKSIDNLPELSEGLEELSEILEILDEMSVPKEKVVFDFTLARGLDYYTGSVYEVILPDFPELGSVAGGGRYDDLVGLFMKESIPAVGTSFGMERIFTLLKARQERENILHNDIDFLVCNFDREFRADYLGLLSEMRKTDIRCEMYFRPDKMKKQFTYANKKNIPFVVIIGSDEKDNNCIKIKDMISGKQDTVKTGDFIDYAKNLVKEFQKG